MHALLRRNGMFGKILRNELAIQDIAKMKAETASVSIHLQTRNNKREV